ncbi:MAG: pilus (MSHA type) biogenesis protein MshL [Gammaproteobacteria bacterium]
MIRTLALVVALVAGGCGAILPRPPETSTGHLRADKPPPARGKSPIPRILEQAPFLPPPQAQSGRSLETYTVVVNEVPAKELLFALARDAALNVDIHPGIEGLVTINAVDQTLPQIMDRVSRQVELRYELRDSDLIVTPDLPYFRTYKIDYVNIARDTKITNTMATQIASTGTSYDSGGSEDGGGGNFSSTAVSATSNYRLWSTLTTNILAIIDDGQAGSSAKGGIPVTANVIPNPESGIINVRASSRQHAEIQKFIDTVLGSAKRQVLIEATIVDVTLNDTHQAGIDWTFLSGNPDPNDPSSGSGFDISSLPSALFAGSPQTFVGTFFDNSGDEIRVTVQALERFGDVKVLSSPRLMVLNNQTALLKVARNVVYFEIEQNIAQTQGAQNTTFETNVHTVPVGFMMTVTPQINDNGIITLNVRPTISRIFQFVPDPAAQLIAGAQNQVPEIEVRELESMLRLRHGQIGLLGGLMQDNVSLNTEGVPLLSRIPGIGNAFKARDNSYEKNELVIFLRPVVVEDPSLDTDLVNYRPYLEDEFSNQPHSIYHDY